MKLKKKLLSQVPIKNASDEYINLAKNSEKKYLVSGEEIQVGKNKILLMYFYYLPDLAKEDMQAEFRTFQTHDDYITEELGNTRKWRTGSLANVVSGHHWSRWYDQCVIACDGTSKTMSKYLDISTGEDPLKKVGQVQEEIMAKRLAKKHKVITDRIDKKMEEVTELPEDFDKWIEHTALYHSRYIYYTYKARKKLDGYCTHCKTDVVVEAPRHNANGTCPNCKSPITFKAMGKSKRVEDRGQATYIQKNGNGIIVRYFSIVKRYGEGYKKPDLSYMELARDFYDEKGTIECYEHLEFKQTGKERWCDGQGKFGFYNGVLYDENLDGVLKGTQWQYSAIKEFATHKKGFGFSAYRYLEIYKVYPVLEYLVKLKLYKLAQEVVYIPNPYGVNLDGSNLGAVLNVGKSQLAIAQRIDAGASELRIIREAERVNLKLTDDQILFIAEHLEIESLIKMAEHTTVHKIIRYISAQATKDIGIADTFKDWRDYIKDCKELKYDLENEFVLFPRDFRAAHDLTYKLIEGNKNKLLDKKIKKISAGLAKDFNWEYKEYLVIAPTAAYQITREGQRLRHCVGNYAKQVADGKTIILFLRLKDEPDQPYYTIEVNPKNKAVRQCRGMRNKSMSGDIEKVIDLYKKEKLAPLIRQAI